MAGIESSRPRRPESGAFNLSPMSRSLDFQPPGCHPNPQSHTTGAVICHQAIGQEGYFLSDFAVEGFGLVALDFCFSLIFFCLFLSFGALSPIAVPSRRRPAVPGPGPAWRPAGPIGPGFRVRESSAGCKYGRSRSVAVHEVPPP